MEQMHTILKRLRKQKGLSQDALAELLGISAAAVSKWENAVTMPDISQIVPLVNIFGISADELFGISGRSEDEEIDRVLTELYKLEDIYPPEEGVKIVDAYRAALREHPKSTALHSEALAFYTMLLTNYDVLSVDEQTELIVDCVRSVDIIMKYSDSETRITSAKRCLIDIYCKQGEFDRATDIASRLPCDISMTRDIEMTYILWKAGRFDEEKTLHVKNIGELASALDTQVIMLANRYKDEGNYADALTCYNFANKILDAIYDDEKYRPPFIKRGVSHFGFPALCLVRLGRDDEALDLLEKFAEHYIAERDGFNIVDSFDIPILRGKTYRFGLDGNAKFEEYFRQVTDMPEFEKFKDEPRFASIVEALEHGV